MSEQLARVVDLTKHPNWVDQPKWENVGLPDSSWLRTHKRPDTPFEALMTASPWSAVEHSSIEGLALREIISDAFSVLTEEETFVFDGIVIEGLSYRTLARELKTSKSSVFRTKKRAIRKLQMALENDPEIVRQLQTRHFKQQGSET